MRFKEKSADEFCDIVKERSIICFGASKHIQTYASRMGYPQWLDNIIFFVDSNADKIRKFSIEGYDKTWNVYLPEILCDIDEEVALLITPVNLTANMEIIGMLEQMNLPDNISCFNMLQMKSSLPIYDNSALRRDQEDKIMKIEKKIHCFWFSGEAKSEMYVKCIESWKKQCPDYEIIEWNTDNYDVTRNKYMKQAFEKKKWAFVSDYARLDVIYRYGGIYLDMDVELIKCLDDLLEYECFFAKDNEGLIDLGSGFGAEKEFPLIGKLLAAYDGLEFECNDGKIDFNVTVPQPSLLLPIFKKEGYEQKTDSQIINDTVFLSPDYIRVIEDPYHNYRELKGTEYAIHWHHAGWFDKESLDERTKRLEPLREFLKKYKTLCSQED